MDVNAYLPLITEGLAGIVLASMIAGLLRANAAIAAALGLAAGIGLGFWLEYSGHLAGVAGALGSGWSGMLGSAAIAGGAGGAAAGLVSGAIFRRRRA